MLEERYRRLLAPLDSPGATGRFVIARELPPEGLIANAYIVPRVRSEWLYLIQSDGRLQLPGGKKELGESHREALDRELLEEAGAEILDTSLIGHWLLRSKRERAFRPHLSHPESAAVVFSGTVRLVAEPINPAGSGQTREVVVAPLTEVVAALRADRRDDLADLYLLASDLVA
jgi:8-oxo-dGTP pyrophosphatase MutT (NUDIX family)